MLIKTLVTSGSLLLASAVAMTRLQTPSTSSAIAECTAIAQAVADHAGMDHGAHDTAMKQCNVPTSPGQAAYGAISEIVRLLKADSTTDWSRVNLEALRKHLIEMNDVIMNAQVTQRNVADGAELEVTGSGTTVAAIRRMSVNHSKMLDQGNEYRAQAREIPNGVLLTITARKSGDKRMTDQIRGLGFAGLMTDGDHHAPHHLALARGTADPHAK